MRGTVNVIDRDLEARKHLWQGLQRLGPARRTAFLRELCATVHGPGGVSVRVTEAPSTVGEAYADVMMWSMGFGGCLHEACRRMEQRLKRL